MTPFLLFQTILAVGAGVAGAVLLVGAAVILVQGVWLYMTRPAR